MLRRASCVTAQRRTGFQPNAHNGIHGSGLNPANTMNKYWVKLRNKEHKLETNAMAESFGYHEFLEKKKKELEREGLWGVYLAQRVINSVEEEDADHRNVCLSRFLAEICNVNQMQEILDARVMEDKGVVEAFERYIKTPNKGFSISLVLARIAAFYAGDATCLGIRYTLLMRACTANDDRDKTAALRTSLAKVDIEAKRYKAALEEAEAALEHITAEHPVYPTAMLVKATAYLGLADLVGCRTVVRELGELGDESFKKELVKKLETMENKETIYTWDGQFKEGTEVYMVLADVLQQFISDAKFNRYSVQAYLPWILEGVEELADEKNITVHIIGDIEIPSGLLSGVRGHAVWPCSFPADVPSMGVFANISRIPCTPDTACTPSTFANIIKSRILLPTANPVAYDDQYNIIEARSTMFNTFDPPRRADDVSREIKEKRKIRKFERQMLITKRLKDLPFFAKASEK
eukprot:TRINITY_DN27098_c0_g1_i1.p1 TRINITY_DN27098_c0_g1~~TRINITY_DN27098_c0_g1_i1.p1  ORF type:complete len:465 (+),score=89.72 TRINITY_DN27098_c0_g1_i1:386-1780(+)